MTTIERYYNPLNNRAYILEYGIDLFDNCFVKVRYGIALGISKQYLYCDPQNQTEKIDEIKHKRLLHGYVRR